VDVDALIAEAHELVRDAEPVSVPVTLGRRKVMVRFVPMEGTEWRALVLQHPPRPSVAQDMNLGYNIDAVAAAYPHVALTDGETVDDLMRERDGKPYSKWPEVYGALNGVGLKDVARELWAAHELRPEQAVEAAGKASPGSRKKRSS